MNDTTQLDIFTSGPRGSVHPREHACGSGFRPSIEGEKEEPTIAERFEVWLADNPKFFEVFRAVAIAERAAGYKTGAKGIVEQMRSRRMVADAKTGKWKYDNTFTALLARRLVEVDGSFADYFEFRERRSE